MFYKWSQWGHVACTGGLETTFSLPWQVLSDQLPGALGPTWPPSPYPCQWALLPFAQGSNRTALAEELRREAHFLPWSSSSGGLGAPTMGRSGLPQWFVWSTLRQGKEAVSPALSWPHHSVFSDWLGLSGLPLIQVSNESWSRDFNPLGNPLGVSNHSLKRAGPWEGRLTLSPAKAPYFHFAMGPTNYVVSPNSCLLQSRLTKKSL